MDLVILALQQAVDELGVEVGDAVLVRVPPLDVPDALQHSPHMIIVLTPCWLCLQFCY